MSILFSCSLFYLSFTPLWLSVIIIDIKSFFFDKTSNYWTELISIVCIIAFTIFSIVVLFVEMHNNKKIGLTKYTLVDAKEEKTITAEFLLSYILPLSAFDFTLWIGAALFIVFFLALGYLSVKHKYFSVNIVLELVKYRFYTCILKTDDGIEMERTIISRRKLNGCNGEDVSLKFLNNEYGLDIE